MIRNENTMTVADLACFGKLPLSREFIVEGSKDLPDSGFAHWIGEGVGMAKARLGERYDTLISSFPRYRFYWDGGEKQRLAGVIVPSEDAAGRKHPFALFAYLRGAQKSMLSTALQVTGIQEQSAQLLGSLSATATAADLRELIRGSRLPAQAAETELMDRYRHFVAGRSGGAFWRSVAPADGKDERYIVCQALVETLAPSGNDKLPSFRGGIRYPISGGDGVESEFESCFWVDFSERRLGTPLDGVCWLRAPGDSAAATRHFYLFLSPPSGNQWISLIDPEADLDSISYLDRPYGSEAPEERMDSKLRDILESETASFDAYLRWASGS